MTVITMGSLSTATSLQLQFSQLISYNETGNSEILGYNIWWDANTGVTNISLTETIMTNYTVNGLIAGYSYMFKIRAFNIYGYGPFSEIITLVPNAAPSMMNIPTIEV